MIVCHFCSTPLNLKYTVIMTGSSLVICVCEDCRPRETEIIRKLINYAVGCRVCGKYITFDYTSITNYRSVANKDDKEWDVIQLCVRCSAKHLEL
jgi:hypothetical protein